MWNPESLPISSPQTLVEDSEVTMCGESGVVTLKDLDMAGAPCTASTKDKGARI